METPEKITFAEVLRYRFLYLIRKKGFFIVFLETIIVSRLLLHIFFNFDFVNFFVWVFFTSDFAFLSLPLAYIFFTHWKQIKKFFAPKVSTIEGIPIPELVDYLFENQCFPAKEVMKVFSLNTKSYTRLSKQLEFCKILVRGKYNSYVLNSSRTRKEVVSQLSHEKISPLLRIFRFSTPRKTSFSVRKIS